MKKIYIFENVVNSIGHIGVAICEDGAVLASHCSSDELWLKQDMGLYPEMCKWKHDAYEKHCPEGYELEYVEVPNIETHEGLKKAFDLNKQLSQPGGE